jgi:hypothetical protein
VDRKYGKEIIEKINQIIKAENFMMNLPIEIRFTKRDEIWLSPQYERDSCCFTLQMFGQEDRRALFFNKLEQLFAEYKGRPHWGKWHTLTCAQLQQLYPKWNDWLRFRFSMSLFSLLFIVQRKFLSLFRSEFVLIRLFVCITFYQKLQRTNGSHSNIH